MDTQFATSADGTPVAYDCCGAGPALLLLHGGGGRRQEWHEAGYVERLRDEFTIVTLDLRGHGQSGQPTDPAAYAIDKMQQDVLAVADACGIERFALWGMSYGGKVGRYLAVHSRRVIKAVLMGTPLGPGVTGQRRQEALDFCVHWPPILQAQGQGTLAPETLSENDRTLLQQFDVAVMLGWVRAMLDWPSVEPADFICPVLWLIGAEDRHALDSVREYERALPGSRVLVQIVEGLDHELLFDEVDRVLEAMVAFTRG